MPDYVKDYAQLLTQRGEAAYGETVRDPMLIILGLARQLQQGAASERTVVATKTSEDLEVSSLVGRVFPIRKELSGAQGPVSLGRTAETDMRIPEYSISKLHCEFRLTAGDVFVRDAGSTNGTELEGRRLGPGEEAKLLGGETLVLGRFAFRFDTPSSLLRRLKRV